MNKLQEALAAMQEIDARPDTTIFDLIEFVDNLTRNTPDRLRRQRIAAAENATKGRQT
jgi:hypothetical protein